VFLKAILEHSPHHPNTNAGNTKGGSITV